MNSELARAHRATNALHSCALLGGMGIVFLLWFSPRIAPSVIMRLYGTPSVQWGETSLLPLTVRARIRSFVDS